LALSVRNLENTERIVASNEVDTLENRLSETSKHLDSKTDSINQFLKYLKDSFGIVQGAANRPIQINHTDIKTRDINGDLILGSKYESKK